MKCERWDRCLDPEDGCEFEASHTAAYSDGVTLELCAGHAHDAELETDAEVTQHKRSERGDSNE